MWPQTLEMSRDECRGMLRRLELESYSHIISVFRAQGSLSEPKAKLLEELRQLFHITQERHRAEVRRAANDEQLCTIAENVCGPNTWQEWSREGRRPYPLLPRINPQTALSIVANDLAAKAYAENAKLAAPHETGANLSDALTEQVNFQIARHGMPKLQETHVVMDEPFKVPDLPNEIKKATLKRKENDLSDAKPNKKRNTQHDRQLGLGQQQQTPAGSGGSQSGVIKDEDCQAALALEQRPNARTQQQRYFYQQQQKHKQRLGSKKGAGNALANHSAIAAGGGGINTKPAKSGRRRAQKQLQQQLQQQQKQQQQQLQQQLQQQQQLQEQQQQQQQLQQPPQQQQQQLQQQKVLLSAEPTTTTTTATPIPHANHLVQPHVEYILDEALKSVAATKLKTVPTSVRRKVYASSDVQYVCSPIIFKEKLSPTVQQQQTQQQQQQQISTPVKKYIVEDRQQPTASPTPIASAAAASPVASISTANLPLAPQIISVQQIAAPPQVRSNPTVVSTGTATATILPPGTKLTPKKINLIDKQQLPTVPNTAVRLLPLPASAYTEQTQTNAAPIGIAKPSTAVQAVQKYIVEERVPSQSTTGTPLSSASAVNIIKNIPASSLNNTLITPLSNSVTPVTALGLRKASVAATTTVTGAGSSASTAAATSTQLLGNTIKLSSGSAIKHVRNIKICSPNGNVFLPAKLTAGSIIHKLNATNVAGASGATGHSPTASGSGAGTPTSPQPTQQRITIQKMQLLTPTQVSAATVGGGATTASAGSGKVKPTTLTLTTAAAGVGKNNLVFLPTSGMRAVTLATNKPKTGVGVGVGAGVGAELLAAKPNVLVIGPSSSSSSSSTSNAPTTIISSSSSSAVKSKAHQQLITEDTPIDIINMPIIVADNGVATEHSSKTTTPAVSSSKPAGAASMVVLNATDWEMELDQASKAASVAATTSTAAAATTAATTPANAAKNTKLEHIIVEEVCAEESLTQLKNQMIELQEDEDSAIEYVDMELEQPIEIESTSNISPETMTTTTSSSTTTTTSSNVSSSSSSLPNSSSMSNSTAAAPSKSSIILLPSSDKKKKQEQQVATKVEGVTAARITVTTSTLP